MARSSSSTSASHDFQSQEVDATQTRAALTDPGMVMGTAGYMAPEQVRGQQVDGRADLFSLGVVLYEMVAGHRAFARESAVESLNAILKDDPPELTTTRPDVPPALDRIVRHCLEKNPAERFQSARDVIFALETLTGTSGSGSVPPAVVARRTRHLHGRASGVGGCCARHGRTHRSDRRSAHPRASSRTGEVRRDRRATSALFHTRGPGDLA